MCIAGKLIKMRIRNLTTPERDKDYKKSYIPLVRLYTHLDKGVQRRFPSFHSIMEYISHAILCGRGV